MKVDASMTEGGWEVCADPARMLAFLRQSRRASERKQLLFAVACSRRLWDSLSSQARAAVELAERYADGEATWEELSRAIDPVAGRAKHPWSRIKRFVDLAFGDAQRRAMEEACRRADDRVDPRDARFEAYRLEQLAQEGFLRDLFGNPFRPVTIDPTWLTAHVLERARAIDAGRAYDRLPDLADALEAAGCRDPELLGHLRDKWPHVRGCWAVDLALGKP